MPSVYEIVRDAVANKKQITAMYDGLMREMCPHCIGSGKDGSEYAWFFQCAGGSKKGLPFGGAWRCIKLDQLTNVTSKAGPWYTLPAQHSKPQTCVKQVDLEVAY